jgi:hypothetical protein
MRYLFFPSSAMLQRLQQWRPRFENKFVVGIQLRHSILPGDDHTITPPNQSACTMLHAPGHLALIRPKIMGIHC